MTEFRFPTDLAAVQNWQDLPIQNVVQVCGFPFSVGEHRPALGIPTGNPVGGEYCAKAWDDWHRRLASLGFWLVRELFPDGTRNRDLLAVIVFPSEPA